MRVSGWGDLSLKQWAQRVKLDGVTLWFAWRDPRTPWSLKALIAFVVGYALSPIDLIPDFIPVLGYVDDVLLLPILIWIAMRCLPLSIRRDCQVKAQAWLDSGTAKPRLAWGAALIISIWVTALLILGYLMNRG
jgi:uncharacterized membrane protein YkvA (DUF1232 family)